MTMPPLLDSTATTRLRDAFIALGYTTDGVLARIGGEGQAGLARNVSVPADMALTTGDALEACIRVWLLQRSAPKRQFADALPLDELAAADIVRIEGDQVRAAVDVRPYGSPDDGASGWLVSDLTPGFDHQPVTVRPDYVLGASPASTTLAQMTMRPHVGTALDLGTGCGIQSLHLARHAGRVVATDLNPRALQLARLTLDLSGADDVELREGSLWEPVTDDTYDLVVTNPPYVMSPPSAQRLVYREGSFEGDGLVRAVVSGAWEHLNPGGTLQVLGNWAITNQPWAERLDTWAHPEADFWVIERERLSVHEYIEMWLTDAGLHQTPAWEQAYRDWVDYFTTLGITGVGMGWLTLTRSERAQPERRFEQWPWAVEQPVGPVFKRSQRDLDASRLPDEALYASRFCVADHVVEESIGSPGAAGPEHIVLRQTSGLRRAIDAGTALAAVVGACDGDLPLGAIMQAVAQLLEVDANDLQAELGPRLRETLRDGFLDLVLD